MNKIATNWHRILAFLIDYLSRIVVTLLLLWWLSSSFDLLVALNRLMTLLVSVFLIYPLFFPMVDSLLISTFGGTLGKILTGTRIVGQDGNKPTFWKAYFRNYIGYIISGMFFWLGFIWVAVDKQKRAWHDQIAGTYVVVVNRAGFIIGIISLLVLLFVNTSLWIATTRNFSRNSEIYSNVVKDLEEMGKESDIPLK